VIKVPEFEWKPLGRAGGTYDRTRPMKICWHTWEGTNWSGAESTFRNYPPHIGAKFPEVPRQYVDLARHSYAFRGSESDDEPIIQIEVAGFAKHMRYQEDEFLRWMATITDNINRALHNAGWDTVDATTPPNGFRDELDREWAPLASARSRLRFTNAELESFSGHLGHQHVPAPDSHWDPGALNVKRMLGFCRYTPGELVTQPPTPEDDPLSALTDTEQRKLYELVVANDLRLQELQAEVVGIKAINKDTGKEESRMDRLVNDVAVTRATVAPK
jgi:hypothetical protein